MNYFLPKKASKSGLSRSTPLRRVSQKQRAKLKDYSKLRLSFLTTSPLCFICEAVATDIHHKEGRGSKTNDTTTWMAICRSCHTKIHNHPSWARENNYLK